MSVLQSAVCPIPNTLHKPGAPPTLRTATSFSDSVRVLEATELSTFALLSDSFGEMGVPTLGGLTGLTGKQFSISFGVDEILGVPILGVSTLIGVIGVWTRLSKSNGILGEFLPTSTMFDLDD